jgi:triacylglycerol lipase
MPRKLIALAVAVVALLAPAASAHAVDPILFVHGWSDNASRWDTMIGRFRADGWSATQLRAFSYSSFQSNATIAQTVSQEVNQLRAATGAAKVDVVTHSMGALSSRYYLKNLGGTANVDEWVSLGGPNHGTDTANFCAPFVVTCREMQIGSAFLTALNSGDETPGSVNYRTWWSPCDFVINPDSSVSLSGATNTRTGCVGHNSLPTDATVYAQVRDFVR